MFPLCVPPKSIWCCHSCHIKHNDKIMHTDEERGALSAICLTHQKYIVYLPHQSNQFILHLDSFGLEKASVVVNSSLGMATPGCHSSPEVTSIGRDWAEEVKRKNGRPAPNQVPQSTLRSDFQVSWRIWLACTLQEDTTNHHAAAVLSLVSLSDVCRVPCLSSE